MDTLSHRPDHTQEKDDNTDRMLLKGEWLRNVVIQKGEFWRKVEEAEEFIEEEVRGAIERREERWRKDGKVLLWRERVYVPDSITL